MTTAESRALERLGYHVLWISSGVLTLGYLKRQAVQFDTPDSDQNTEHYSNAALQHYLNSKQKISDAEVASLLELGELDPEESFRSHYPHSLIHFAGLTDPQFDLVAAALDEEGFLRQVCRRRILRLLSQKTSEQLFDRAIREGDADVHRAVLDRPELARHHLELLVTLGRNKVVRNIAVQLLRSRRFRQ